MLNMQAYTGSYDQNAFPAMDSSDGEGQYLHVSNGPFGAQRELDVEERFVVTSQQSRGERRNRVRVKFNNAITDDDDDAPDFDKMAGRTLQPSSRILDIIMDKIEAPPPSSSQGSALREKPLPAIRPESTSLIAAKASRTLSVTSVTQVSVEEQHHHQDGETSKRRHPSPAPLDEKSSALSWNWLGGMKSPSLSSEAAAESGETTRCGTTRSRTTISRTETRCIASEIVDFLQLDTQAPPRRRRRPKPPRFISETLLPDLLDDDGRCSSSEEQALTTEIRKPMPTISTFPGSLRLENGEISHEKKRMSFQELRLALPSPLPDPAGKKRSSGTKKSKPRWNSGKPKKESDKSKSRSHHRRSSKTSASKKVTRKSKP